jgi:hypothetical protein
MQDFTTVDAARRACGLTPRQLCELAGVPYSTWWRAASGKTQRFMTPTQKRFRAALNGERPRSVEITDDGVLTAYRFYVAHLAPTEGLTAEDVLASEPAQRATGSADWIRCARVRELAVFCVNQQLNVSPARIGRLLGLSRQAAHQMLRRVIRLRNGLDDEKLERLGRLFKL